MDKGILHHGDTIISLESLPDYSDPVVVKKPSKRHPSRRGIQTLETEYEMTRSLNAVEGIRKALGQKSIENQPALILEYIDGETLRDHIEREKVSLRAKLKIAIDMARVLGNVHRENVVHLDLNSNNVLIGNEKQVHLIDLGSASHIDRSGHQRVRPDQVLGTLSYISPEQTGRINRAIDERSDLYSLGVIFYELMAGKLPFDSTDPMELVHHHIARKPVSPSGVASEIPKAISSIILKLLRKSAEDRYQSAAGVQADLEKCLQRLSQDNTIAEFPLGEGDYSSRLIFPQKLYGRNRETKQLEDTFESVCRGSQAIVFVGGYSGIGKTVLIEEIQRPVSEKSGYFIEGKFDQLGATPYSGIAQALAQFVSQILTQPEAQLAAWRSKILEAVGPNGGVLTDVVPSLELIIGPQPAVPDLSEQEVQNRFYFVFQRFFGAIARREHPICFFLDDLQWIDPASLALLKNLFSSPDLAYLLVVGAYRDNEVHEDHPLMMLIADLERAGANLRRMTLPKLSEVDVEALISVTLTRDPGEVRELSRLVYSQTDGNPFFTRQVLRSLEDQGLIVLDTATGHWRWDMDALRRLDFIDSVIELLVSKLKELPVDIQETLKVAACIGNQFDVATLTVVTEGDGDAILDHVQEAIAADLIWESSEHCYFVHDRIQETAYALVPPEDRDRTHLTIGRLMLERPRASDHEQDLYKIVDHLNHGLQLVEDKQERFQIARLNLQAAQAARRASAFKTGLNYAKAGIELLGENSWDQDYHLTLELREQAALLAHAAGDIPAMKQHSEQVLHYGRDSLDLARVQRLHVEFLLSSKRFDEAIDFGLEALSILGQEFPANPDMAFTIAKLSELLECLEREPPDYLSIPRLEDQDKELLAISEILLTLGSVAFISRPALAPLIYMRSLELSLDRRLLSEHTPTMIAAVGVFANALLGEVELAHRYGETAMELAAANHTSIYIPLHVHALYNHFWRKPLRETLDLFDRARQSAYDFGSNEFVSYVAWGWSKHAFYASIELAQVEERCLKLRTFVDDLQYVTQSRWVNIYVTAVLALRGSSSARGTTWRGTPFDDDRDLPDLQRVEDQLGLLCVYCAKAWVATLFGDHDGVEEYSDLSFSYLVAAPAGLEKAILTFISGLRRARELRVVPESPESEQALQEQLGLLDRFAGLAPMNFAHKLSLVQAEVHRARGEVLPAMKAYEQASQGARENGYLNEAGLAHALAAEFYQDLGLHQAALHNAEQAAQAWRSWGAHALVESLSQRLPDLVGLSESTWHKGQETVTGSTTPIQLDLTSITSASQLLSSETDPEQLLARMINLVMTNSGAEKAVLLLKQEDEWSVQARGSMDAVDPDVFLDVPYDPSNKDHERIIVPERVFEYCRRSNEPLIVGNAQVDSRFAEDKLIQQYGTQSIACIPALSQGKIRAMLYLENCQTSDAFTLDRVEILKHLSAQFCISMENALLYDSMKQNARDLQESRERYRLAVAGSAAGIWDWDIRSDTVYYSGRLQELLGYRSGEFSDSQDEFWNRLHPDDLRAARVALNKHVEQGAPYFIDCRLETKSGEYRWFHVRGQALWDEEGRATRMSGSVTDIAVRKRMEQELMKSEERFRNLMEQSPLGIELLTPEGQISRVNAAWKRLWGLNDEATEQVLANYNMLTDPQIEDQGIMPLVEKAFAGESVVLPPIPYSGKQAADNMGLKEIDTKSPWIQCQLYSVKDENGEIMHVVNIYTDITDLRRFEQEAREQRDALARLDRARGMGQLTGSISHELNQPLTGILSNAQAAQMLIEQGQWEEDELAEIVAEIVSDTKRAGDVIRNLREAYREQKGEFQPVDINAVVDETAQLLHSEFVMQNVELTTACSSSIPKVDGNRIQIQQVLINLMMNSIQAMSSLAREDRRIHIATSYEANEVKACVEDCGTGIDDDKIARIFEPLATWKPGGTGMGLAISNSIIEAHGGRMWAENRPEGGARVGFALPILIKGQEHE